MTYVLMLLIVAANAAMPTLRPSRPASGAPRLTLSLIHI